MNYDLKIINGLVFDGEGNEPVAANVGIKDGIIVEVGACEDSADRVINAVGKIVTPGFIDLHSHAVRASAERSGLFRWPDAENLVRQGVTTVIGGPDGWSPLPLGEHFAAQLVGAHRRQRAPGVPGRDRDRHDVSEGCCVSACESKSRGDGR